MENLLDAIRASVAADATDETKAAGAAACRTILTALEGTPGAPLAAPIFNASEIASAVSMMRGVPAEQLLDLAIARLRAALPDGDKLPAVKPTNFRIVPIPPLVGKRS